MTLSRRQFVSALVLASASAYFGDRQFNWTGLQTGTPQDLLTDVDRNLLKTMSAQAVGQTQLFDGPPPKRLQDLQETLMTKIQNDFKDERTTEVDGWEFSLTECALAAYVVERSASPKGAEAPTR